jgi:hypothetical protein
MQWRERNDDCIRHGTLGLFSVFRLVILNGVSERRGAIERVRAERSKARRYLASFSPGHQKRGLFAIRGLTANGKYPRLPQFWRNQVQILTTLRALVASLRTGSATKYRLWREDRLGMSRRRDHSRYAGLRILLSSEI